MGEAAKYGARFRQKFTLEDAIGSHACSLEANTRVTNGIPLGSSLLLSVCTLNRVQPLKTCPVSRPPHSCSLGKGGVALRWCWTFFHPQWGQTHSRSLNLTITLTPSLLPVSILAGVSSCYSRNGLRRMRTTTAVNRTSNHASWTATINSVTELMTSQHSTAPPIIPLG
jgi:hypothetical protein